MLKATLKLFTRSFNWGGSLFFISFGIIGFFSPFYGSQAAALVLILIGFLWLFQLFLEDW